MLKWLTGGIAKSIENVASAWIETSVEKAEGNMINAQAETLMLKTLDPNGKMRRDLSKFACIMYALYLVPTMIMVFMVAFGIGNDQGAKDATAMLTDYYRMGYYCWG